MRIYPVVLVLIALFSAPVFAKPTSALHEKYQFDQLETVKRFNNWSIDGWSAIDQQSLIVRTSPSTSYLLVLSRRLPELRYSHAIAITSTGSSVYARFDSVRALNRHGINIPVSIAKIYKLKGKKQRKLVRAQITSF